MSLEMVAETTAEFELPWLKELNNREFESSVSWSKVKIEAGSQVYLDQARRRFRMVTPWRSVLAWDGQRRLRVTRDQSWVVSWETPETYDAPRFGFADVDGEYTVLSTYMEGKEHLFADFCALIFDAQLNPLGFPLQDGQYGSDDDHQYDVQFGRDGSQPRMEVIKPFVPVDPLLPAKFIGELTEDVQISDGSGGTALALSGQYNFEITGWNFKTGEVYFVRMRGPSALQAKGADLLKLADEGKFNILQITQRSMDTH